MRKWPDFILKFWGSKAFGMKKLPRKNRVVQGDRVIEGRVIEGDYCISVNCQTLSGLPRAAWPLFALT